MALGSNGTVFVGTRDEGKVYALTDLNGDFIADKPVVIASGLDMPNGVAFRDGSLYIAEVSRVSRMDRIEERLKSPGKPVVIRDTFPGEHAHGWKYIAFGPDGFLYVPVGFPCNICEPRDAVYGSIFRMKPDGTSLESFTRGVRNTVGFDFDPATGDLWFTDNGRDWLGDNIPPDELNHAPVSGLHFGFPYMNGKDKDPEYGNKGTGTGFTFPVQELGAHVAALGMKFYSGNMFPAEYKNRVFIAEHGSWNRTVPSGYRVTMVVLKDGGATEYGVFAYGWLKADWSTWGRPVDLLVLKDGSLLVSDDKAGAIYRITYRR
jgi:glucose/arabinose dehydrogenase